MFLPRGRRICTRGSRRRREGRGGGRGGEERGEDLLDECIPGAACDREFDTTRDDSEARK